jgi:hypothetical protein
MTNVSKVGTDSANRTANAPNEGAADKPGAARFEQVLRDKSGAAAARADKGAHGDARAEGHGGQGGAEGAAGGPHAHASRQGSSDEPSGGWSGGGDGGRRDDAFDVRAMPGDLAMPSPIRWEAAPAETAAASRAADMAARIEEIAAQIVQAAEVRLGREGAVEVNLQLSLGGLGEVHVGLARDANGQIRIGFDAVKTETADLLKDQAPELLARLEARGIEAATINVRGAGEVTAAPLVPAAREEQPANDRRSDDERQQRRPSETLIPSEDE